MKQNSKNFLKTIVINVCFSLLTINTSYCVEKTSNNNINDTLTIKIDSFEDKGRMYLSKTYCSTGVAYLREKATFDEQTIKMEVLNDSIYRKKFSDKGSIFYAGEGLFIYNCTNCHSKKSFVDKKLNKLNSNINLTALPLILENKNHKTVIDTAANTLNINEIDLIIKFLNIYAGEGHK